MKFLLLFHCSPLQNQVKILTAENKSFQTGDGGLSDIRERTKYTAEQLQSASAVAEKNIKYVVKTFYALHCEIILCVLINVIVSSWLQVSASYHHLNIVSTNF